MSILLSQLFPEITNDIYINKLVLDSRQVCRGDLFFAYKGHQLDGRSFINDALEQGAAVVVYDNDGYVVDANIQHQYPEVIFIAVTSLSMKLSSIAGNYYNKPAQAMRLVGVTGTNGKTSVTQMIAQALDLLGNRCGIIGTLGYGFWQLLQDARQTTPDAISVQENLNKLKEQGAKTVALEVSSHALDQGRVQALPFEVAVFTNLSRDHLDYHVTLDNYAAAKAKLFRYPTLKARIINKDDSYGRCFLEQTELSTFSYSISDQGADLYCSEVIFDTDGIKAKLITEKAQGILTSPLIGQFNLSNLLAVVGTLLAFDFELDTILPVIPKLQSPAGRMQRLGGESKPLVIVDYAHTPDALEKVLSSLKPHVNGQLFCVFGCGGDRDKGKRPLMAAIAEKIADSVIVTDDNPRYEDKDAIIDGIMKGFINPEPIEIIADRQLAIHHAIQNATPQDVVLIAGKGHEDYQEVAGVRHSFSDIAEAKQALANWKENNND